MIPDESRSSKFIAIGVGKLRDLLLDRNQRRVVLPDRTTRQELKTAIELDLALPRYALTALIVACALFMENLDGTVISTSLPAIALDLHEDPLALKLALTSYLLSLAIFIPLSGWAADKYGARTIFRGAIVVFTFGSIFCGFSSSLAGFVLARILQGIGGAMMVPVGRLVLIRSTERQYLVRAMAYLTIPALLGPIAGPIVGGFITTYFNWRWIFFINVPIGVLGFVLVSIFIENLTAEAWPLDVKGFFLSGAGLSALIFGLTVAGRNFVAPAIVIALIGTGFALLVLYILHARNIKFPLLDLRLLTIPTYRASVTGGSLFRVGIGAIPFLLPLMLQVGFGYNAFQSGSVTFVAAAGAMLMKTTAEPIIRLVGFRRVLMFNALLSSCFLVSYGFFTPTTPVVVMLALLLFGGFFRSLQFTSLNVIAYADIEPAMVSRATSFSSVAQQLSLSVGVAFSAAVLEMLRRLHGETQVAAADFRWAFLAVAFVSALSLVSFLRLPADAGAALAGRTTGKATPAR
jgi:EmrB/QacA subfamily drug resistance transporter